MDGDPNTGFTMWQRTTLDRPLTVCAGSSVNGGQIPVSLLCCVMCERARCSASSQLVSVNGSCVTADSGAVPGPLLRGDTWFRVN